MSSNNKSRVITLSLELSMSSYISMQQEFRCRTEATTELGNTEVDCLSADIKPLAIMKKRADDNGLQVRMLLIGD